MPKHNVPSPHSDLPVSGSGNDERPTSAEREAWSRLATEVSAAWHSEPYSAERWLAAVREFDMTFDGGCGGADRILSLLSALRVAREDAARICEEMRPAGGRVWSREQSACYEALSVAADTIRQHGSLAAVTASRSPQSETRDETTTG